MIVVVDITFMRNCKCIYFPFSLCATFKGVLGALVSRTNYCQHI